nr:unnamed protein product [Callosobruchus chinensis]
MSVTWTNELELKFLEYFLAEPVLWNTNFKDYKNKLKNHDAWNRLSALMEVPIDELKNKKLRYLQATEGIQIKLRNQKTMEQVSIVIEQENCSENFVSVYPKEVLTTFSLRIS